MELPRTSLELWERTILASTPRHTLSLRVTSRFLLAFHVAFPPAATTTMTLSMTWIWKGLAMKPLPTLF
jgi:hypothetical protein